MISHRDAGPSHAARPRGASRVLVAAAVLLALHGVPVTVPAQAGGGLDQLLRGVPQLPGSSGQLGDARIGEGLKEALRLGTENAVDFTGRLDGYFANQAIKILLPADLGRFETGLRAIGFGSQVDELVLGMNRAAERAAPAARSIFLDAIGAMTFDDVKRVFNGGDTAATDYFKRKTTGSLTTTFRPIVERSMNEVGVARQWKDLTVQARAIPFVNVDSYDLDGYVVSKGLDGLFHVVAEQERKIRRDPAARVTDLLKDVFGRTR